jgi:hypothetical protein
VIPGQVQYAEGLSTRRTSLIRKQSRTCVSDLATCPLRARQESQERYLTGIRGQLQMLPDLRRGGQRGVTVQFPS